MITLSLDDSLLPLLSSAALWLAGSLLVGALANQLPLVWLCQSPRQPAPATLASRLATYERCLQIRIWKRWIPDAGNALPGGISKASLARRDQAALQRLMAETRRAELVHWVLWPFWLFTLLWLPAVGVWLNLLFATVFNLPCLLLQRYNRLRLRLVLNRIAPGFSAPTSLPRV